MARGQSEPTALGTGAAESAPSSLWGKCRPLAQCRVVFAKGEQAQGREFAGQNWSLCWDLFALRAEAAGVVAALGPGQRRGAPGAVQLCRPRAPRLLAPVRLAGRSGHVRLPLSAPAACSRGSRDSRAPGGGVPADLVAAALCTPDWPEAGLGPMRKAGWARAGGWVGLWGRLGGCGQPGLGAQPREGPLQWSVWTWGLCLAFSERQTAGLPRALPKLTERGALGRPLPPGLP